MWIDIKEIKHGEKVSSEDVFENRRASRQQAIPISWGIPWDAVGKAECQH